MRTSNKKALQPNPMRSELVKAHQALDKAVDLCNRPELFISETKRIEFLGGLYDRYTSRIFGEVKEKGSGKKAKQEEIW